MALKPIQTSYNGYLFRSRLEARWAVFFDELGIVYKYEDEGFDLDGNYYLPDFYLPELDIFIEIKPDFASEHEEYLAAKLAEISKKRVFIFMGNIPNPSPVTAEQLLNYQSELTNKNYESYLSQINKYTDIFGYVYTDKITRHYGFKWVHCQQCGTISLVYKLGTDVLSEVGEFITYDNWEYRDTDVLMCECRDFSSVSNILISGFTKARSARFEHGADPRKPLHAHLTKRKKIKLG